MPSFYEKTVGGKQAGKRGRGAEGKTAILVACEHNDGKPGFVAMNLEKSVESLPTN